MTSRGTNEKSKESNTHSASLRTEEEEPKEPAFSENDNNVVHTLTKKQSDYPLKKPSKEIQITKPNEGSKKPYFTLPRTYDDPKSTKSVIESSSKKVIEKVIENPKKPIDNAIKTKNTDISVKNTDEKGLKNKATIHRVEIAKQEENEEEERKPKKFWNLKSLKLNQEEMELRNRLSSPTPYNRKSNHFSVSVDQKVDFYQNKVMVIFYFRCLP